MNEKEALKILGAKERHPPEVIKEAAQVVLQARRMRDPLAQFAPTPTQDSFLASRTRYKLLSSANRGGKTSCIAVKLARCALRRDPVWTVPVGVNGIYCVFAPRRDQIVDPWFKKLCEGSELKGGPWENEPMIPKRDIKKVYYTHGGGKPMPKVIELTNGHRIWFGVSGDKHAWEGLEGKGMVLGIALDESAGTQNLMDECMVRLLDAHSHPVVKAACGGGWLDWGATETKLNDAFTSFRSKCEDDSFTDYAAFWIKPDENPAIDPAERAKYAQVLSEDAFKARMEGEGGAHEALQVYPQFDDDVHWCDEPYEVKDTDTIYVGYDPGSNVSGLVFCAYSQDSPRVCHVFATKELKRATIAAEAECIRRTVLGRRIEWIAYDQAARKVEKSSGSTVLWQLMGELKKRGMTPKSGFFKGRSNYGDSVPVVRCMLNDRRIILHRGSEVLRAQFKSHRFTEKGGELKEDNIQKGNDHCFVAGTKVLMADFSDKPIEDVAYGDLVWTDMGERMVTGSGITSYDSPVSDYTFQCGDGTITLRCTDSHKIYTQRGYVQAEYLNTDDTVQIFGLTGSNYYIGKTPVSGSYVVYDITVDDRHCFFANGVLVHNCIDSFRYLLSTAPYWKQRDPNPAKIKDDGLDISYSQDKSTLTDEDWNVQEQMRASKLYAQGKLPGWD